MGQTNERPARQNLVIDRNEGRQGGGGRWVTGKILGYRFSALVFSEHADVPDWEIGDSCISKLWVRRVAEHQTVYNWDRGADIRAADAETQEIVDLLCASLRQIAFPGYRNSPNA